MVLIKTIKGNLVHNIKDIVDEIPQILTNPFNKKSNVVVVWHKHMEENLFILDLDPDNYPKPEKSNCFSLEYKDMPYIVVENKKNKIMSFLESKINKESEIYKDNKQLWAILHELAHGSAYQLNDLDDLNKIKLYKKIHGTDTNVSLKKEIHSDMLSSLMMANFLNKKDYNIFLKDLLKYRENTTSENHYTAPAINWIYEHSDDINDMIKRDKFNSEMHKVAKKVTELTINHDFGLHKRESFPYNLNTSLKNSGQIEDILTTYKLAVNKSVKLNKNTKIKNI